MPCSYPYPTFAEMTEAAGNLVTFIRGGSGVDLNCAAHCAYTVAGYGLSIALPDTGMATAMAAAGAAPPLDRQAFATALEGAVQEARSKELRAIDWKTLILQALQLLLQILAGQTA